MHPAKERGSSGEVQTASPHDISQSSRGPGSWARVLCRSGADRMAAGCQGIRAAYNLATATAVAEQQEFLCDKLHSLCSAAASSAPRAVRQLDAHPCRLSMQSTAASW
jgi:hypothetical protein